MLVIVLGTLIGRKLSPIVAFSTIPLIAGFALGYGPDELGEFMAEGVGTVAPTVALFVFAILYFGLMRERGLFEPVVKLAVRLIGDKPIILTTITVLLAAMAHLDGAGATTFLLTIPTLLPIYDRLKVRRLVLLMLVGVSAGIMNMLPWGGPTARASAALGIDAADIWYPLIPVQAFGLLIAILFALIIGYVETKRITRAKITTAAHERRLEPAFADTGLKSGSAYDTDSSSITAPSLTEEYAEDKRGYLSPSDWKFWANVALTLGLLTALFTGTAPLHICFIVAFGIALAINYRSPESHDLNIKRNASEALYMAAVLLAVGAFLGILNGTIMMDEITATITDILPEGATAWIHVLVGIFAVPLDLIMGADPFAFGLLPVVDQIGSGAGISSGDTARALLIGQNAGFSISPLTPSVFLAIGLARVPLGQHIRFTLPWVWASGLLMLGFATLVGSVAL